MIVVGFLAAFCVARVAPELVRAAVPLGVFGYATDGNGTVILAPSQVPKGSDRIRVGDRVLVDRIKPFDRKPGIVGVGFTRQNFTRYLPIERGGREQILRLKATNESLPNRVGLVLRVALYVISVMLGGILFLIKPGIATFGFFIFCLGGEYPTTFADVVLDNPWRQLPLWLGDTIRGASRAGLLLFVGCLAIESPRAQRLLAVVCAVLGLAMGTIHAYYHWLMTFAARPALWQAQVYSDSEIAMIGLIGTALVAALARTRGVARQRTAYIVAALAFAGAARLVSDAWFPRYIPFWLNSILLTTSVIPIVVVWVAVVRHHFFDVDWVVSRAVVYVALTGAFIGTLTAAEEIGTYVFYNNTDLAYGFLIVISTFVGAFTGKIKGFLDMIVDRFVFSDRHAQRLALELIAGYILDAETVEDVRRALLEDAAHALKLSFSGILTRREDGSFVLEQSFNWPDDCVIRLDEDDELTRTISRSRGAIAINSKDTQLIHKAFPHERLTFAAPLFLERQVTAIVVYGHNVMGLDLDPDERDLLVRVVAHASLSLTALELARYREEERAKQETLSELLLDKADTSSR